MNEKMETRLVKKTSPTKNVCTSCKREIKPNEEYLIEEGIEEHLHSLLARRYCHDCYRKYGESLLSMTD